MSEILTNTGSKLWSTDDYNELWLNVFEELTGTGGKSNIRLIDEAIGKINSSLGGYYFLYENDRLYICKDNTESGTTTTSKLPVSLIQSDGKVASSVDGTTITIDENGVLHGATDITVDDVLSLTSTNPVQNKVVKTQFDEVDQKIKANETVISSHTTAIETLNGEGEGSVKKTVTDEIAKVVADAPEDFDTLKEMSDWISSHESDASAMNSAIQKNTSDIATLQTDKVDKEIGKGLSTNDYTTDEKTKLSGLDDTLLNKLGESTEGTLTFNGSEIKTNTDYVADTLAEAQAAIESGLIEEGASVYVKEDSGGSGGIIIDSELSDTSTNPVQNKIVTQELNKKADSMNYDESNNILQLMSGDIVLKELEIKGGGSATISPKPTVNPKIKNNNRFVTITWEDPTDVMCDGVTLSKWTGTKLIMKESGYPENENDGTVILNNTTRDKYKTTGYQVTGLMNGNTYYFALFPYSADGIYNYSESNRLLGEPNTVKLDACTNMSISTAMGSATVSWTDPDETKTVNNNTATWSKTVLVYKEGSTAPTSASDGTVAVTETIRNQYSSSGYKVSELTNGKQYTFALFAISTEDVSSDATTASAKLWSTLTITTDETTLYSKTVTATYNSSTVSGTFSSTGSATLQIPWIGETTITSTDGSDTATSKITISAYGSTYSAELSFLKIVTFADGTDEEIVAMIQAHYNGKINLSDFWAVGDKRSVSLSTMSATGVGESHRAQTVQFAIADFEHDVLTTPINGHTKAAITLTQVDCLMDASNASSPTNGSGNTENGYMNSSNTNVGGWTNCARRKWCNDVYYNALPTSIKEAVKEVNKLTSAGNQSSTINTTSDKVFLLSEIEIFGSTTYSVAGEGSQYAYYKNSTANRYKMPKWGSSNASNIWWERSPYSGYAYGFCLVSYSGNANYSAASSAYGVAPCLCI